MTGLNQSSAPAPELRLFGRPASDWAYATRIWLAMMLALYAAFWLQLENPASAAITVGILSQPLRGQVFAKAIYRVLGTLVGFVASIVITALFPQARDLFVLALAGWVALCVYFGSQFSGTQAYAFVLSGYTVAIIVVQLLDHPQNVFGFGIGRLAVVLLGIVSISLVNGILQAPEVFSKVRRGLADALREGEAATRGILHGDTEAHHDAVTLSGTLAGMRDDIYTLPTERTMGARHLEAAKSAVAAIAGAMAAAGMLARAAPSDARETGVAHERPIADPGARGAMLTRYAADIGEERRLATAEVAAFDTGAAPTRSIVLPIVRSRREAFRKALHVFCAVVVSSVFFIVTGWPYASQALVQVIILGSLSAIVPDEKEFAHACLVAMPLAAVIAGITEFLVLDGSDGFPMLAIGMAPGIFAACLLFRVEKTSEIGFLTVIYIPNFIEPSNPQSYDPQLYIFYSFLYTLGVICLTVCLTVIWPITQRDRRRWIMRGLVADLDLALSGRSPFTAPQRAYLASERLAKTAALELGTEAAKTSRFDTVFTISAIALAAQRASVAIDACEHLGIAGEASGPARHALAGLSSNDLRTAAESFAQSDTDAGDATSAAVTRASADLYFLAEMSATRGSMLRHVRRWAR